MRIVIAAEIFPPEIGGPSTYALQLTTALRSAGHEVSVLSYGEEKQQFDFPVYLVSRNIPFFFRQYVYFFRLLKIAWDADVIYAQGPSVGPAAVYLKRLRKKAAVIKYVGDQAWQQIRVRGERIPFEEFLSSYGSGRWGFKIWWIQRWQWFALHTTDAIITPSRYLRDVLVRYLKIPESCITVIPNGVMLEENPKRILGTKNILVAARLENWKGIENVIAALAHLPAWTLTIAGDGHEERWYQQLVRDMGVAKRVTFVGRVTHAELKKLFAQAFCFVLGSEYEGMPHILIESWAAHVPVIVSDFPANTELVKDCETGLVFRLKDTEDLVEKITLLESNPELYTRIVENAAREAERYNVDVAMQQTIAFLENISKKEVP